MNKVPTCSAILLAAGRSKRLGFDKVLTPIGGKPGIVYSLEALGNSPEVGHIAIVTREDLFQAIEPLAKASLGGKSFELVQGGTERQDSVQCGLKATEGKAPYTLIHDGARPLLTPEIIRKVLDKAAAHGAAVAASPATDTLKRATPEGKVIETVDRSEFWQMQTPQVFESGLIREAYDAVQTNKTPITDDASAVEALGRGVFLVDTGSLNLKVTRTTDWQLIDLWLRKSHIFALRKVVHKVCNLLGPLIGYIPLLQRVRGDEARFTNYYEKLASSTSELQEQLLRLQDTARSASPEEPPSSSP